MIYASLVPSDGRHRDPIESGDARGDGSFGEASDDQRISWRAWEVTSPAEAVNSGDWRQGPMRFSGRVTGTRTLWRETGEHGQGADRKTRPLVSSMVFFLESDQIERKKGRERGRAKKFGCGKCRRLDAIRGRGDSSGWLVCLRTWDLRGTLVGKLDLPS